MSENKLTKAIELKIAGDETCDAVLDEYIREIAHEVNQDVFNELFASLGIKYVRMD